MKHLKKKKGKRITSLKCCKNTTEGGEMKEEQINKQTKKKPTKQKNEQNVCITNRIQAAGFSLASWSTYLWQTCKLALRVTK